MTTLSELFIQIPGIGVKTVHKYKKLVSSDIKTIRQLRSTLIKLPQDKFEELPVAAQADLLFQPVHRISRDIIKVVDNEFQKHTNGIRFDIAGSYRREKPQSGDLDIVISTRGADKLKTWENFRKSINSKSRRVRIMEPFAGHEDKITVLFRVCLNKSLREKLILESYHNKARIRKENAIYIKADIFLTNPSEYIFALLFATGSGRFNVRMRRLAKLKGYLLNQRGLYKKSNSELKLVPIKNEREIFDILGMRYREPKDRVA